MGLLNTLDIYFKVLSYIFEGGGNKCFHSCVLDAA
jgi:hypothetical protein